MGPMEGIKYEVWAEIDLNECFLDSLYLSESTYNSSFLDLHTAT